MNRCKSQEDYDYYCDMYYKPLIKELEGRDFDINLRKLCEQAGIGDADADALKLRRILVDYGCLQGFHLNWMLESLPAVAQAVARHHNVTVGGLRRIGWLSCKEVTEAIENAFNEEKESKQMPKSEYPETLIAHACQKAYDATRAHYGPDSNDLADPRGVEQAIRRDVIAVLNGATAKELHKRWSEAKRARTPDVSYYKQKEENPTLGCWAIIPEHDKKGYRIFCKAVHEARREWETADPFAAQRFPRTFQVKPVHKLDSFLADKAREADAQKKKPRTWQEIRDERLHVRVVYVFVNPPFRRWF